MSAPAKPATKRGSGRCPQCGRPRAQEFRPFCSKRCRDLDLANWLDGRYAIPVVDIEDDDLGEEGYLDPRGPDESDTDRER